MHIKLLSKSKSPIIHQIESFLFSDGTPHAKIPKEVTNVEVEVFAPINNMSDLVLLGVILNVLSTRQLLNVRVILPYIPGSRQDRKTSVEEPFTLKVITDIINSYPYDELITFDNHSDVSTALLKNCYNMTNHSLVYSIVQHIKDPFVLVSPDAGALKKINDLNSYLSKSLTNKPEEIVICTKHRDTANGQLSNVVAHIEDLEKKVCVVVDDICDGGNTFIKIAEQLLKKNAGKLILIVSHGIFSNGTSELFKYYSEIYTSDSRILDLPDVNIEHIL